MTFAYTWTTLLAFPSDEAMLIFAVPSCYVYKKETGKKQLLLKCIPDENWPGSVAPVLFIDLFSQVFSTQFLSQYEGVFLTHEHTKAL